MTNITGTQKSYLPILIALGIFIILCIAFCLPIVQGNYLVPGDTISWLYMSKEARANPDALWSNSMFSGMPQTMISQKTPGNWISLFLDNVLYASPDKISNPIPMLLCALINAYILLRVLKVNNWLSIGGAVAFSFSSYNAIIIAAGHNTKMFDMAFVPGIIAGLILLYNGRYALGALLYGICFAIYLDVWHIQIIYYSIFLIVAIVVYFTVKLIIAQKVKNLLYSSAIIGLVSLVCFALTATRILTTQEFSKYSTRGGKSELTINKNANKDGGLNKDYAFQWSNGIGETFCMLIPNLYGGGNENIGEESNFGEAMSEMGVPPNTIEQYTANAPTYWGPQPFLSGPIYVGAIVCFLFVLGMFVIKSKIKWWFLAVSSFMILLSLGKNLPGFNNFMFDHLPIYNKFRTPSMALSIPIILFPIIGFWGLKEVFDGSIAKDELWKKVKLSFYIIGGLAILIILGIQFGMFDFRSDNDQNLAQSFGQNANTLLSALRKDRSLLALKDAFRSLIFIALAFGILWAFIKEKITSFVAIIVIVVATAIDEIPVAHRYLNNDNYMSPEDVEANYFTPRAVEKQIMDNDKTLDYRVFDLSIQTFNSAKTSFFLNTIGGYSPAKLQIYQDLIDMQIGKYNHAVLNMLNTKYIITPAQNAQGQGGGEPTAMPNPEASGNAWFVPSVKSVKSADDEMLALNATSIAENKAPSEQDFDPKKYAVMNAEFSSKVGKIGMDSSATIKMTAYAPTKLEYESNNSQAGLGVFSEIYYPSGWKAFIDGNPAEILKADFALRALSIPAGKHKIEFTYRPLTYDKGNTISMIASIIFVLIVLACAYLAFKRKVTEEKEVPITV